MENIKKPFYRKFIGDKKLYRMLLAVSVPVMVQNAITNFVSLLDNIMVGRLGTEQMSGVSIGNTLLFVFYLCIFGTVSGASIFASQFVGKQDNEGLRYTFRFKLIACTIVTALAMTVLIVFREPLISMYLKGDGDVGDALLTLEYAKEYLSIMMIGLIPYTIACIYASTLRELYQTAVPMWAGIVAVLTNLTLNYILIFGNFGAPELGVTGAAIATVISRFVELGIVFIYTHANAKRYPFIKGAYSSLYIPADLAKQILIKGAPLIANEALWSMGIATLTQCYSLRGLDVVAALNIASTFTNVFNVVFIALGSSASIVIGPMLGANELDEARETAPRIMAFSVFTCFFIGALFFATAPLFPDVYNTTDEVKDMATFFMRVGAVLMPIHSFAHCAYFILRSGGKTMLTILFDSGYSWLVAVPTAFILSRFTALPILPLYFIVQGMEILKCFLGGYFIKKGVWVHNIIS